MSLDVLRSRHRPWCTSSWAYALADFETYWFSFLRNFGGKKARERYERLEIERRARERD